MVFWFSILINQFKKFNIKVVNVAPGDFKTDIITRRIYSSIDNESVYYDDYQNEYNPFSYRFNYNTGLDKFSKHTDITLHSRLLDGLNLNKIKLKKYDYSKKNIFY